MADVTLVPVDHNPFLVTLAPVDHDPFALPDEGDLQAARMSRDAVARDRAAAKGIGNVIAPHLTEYLTEPPPAAPPPPPPGYVGKVPSDSPIDPRLVGAVTDTAQLALLPFGGAEMRGATALSRSAAAERMLESRASFMRPMYDAPWREPRPFAADYPAGGIADDAGKLTFDIEGRPLNPDAAVVGRRMAGAPDEGMRPEEYDALAENLVGSRADILAPGRMGRMGGRTQVNSVTRQPAGIDLRAGLPPDQTIHNYGHELGHAIDQSAGEIPTAGLSDELRKVYNTLNTINRQPGAGDAAAWSDKLTPQKWGEAADWSKKVNPQTWSYKGDDIPREYMAEAIRAYLRDPNYLKTEAPKTAARIREYVNGNPRIARYLQFNSLVPLAGALSLMPVDHDPFEVQ